MRPLIFTFALLIGSSAFASTIMNCIDDSIKPGGSISGTSLTISQQQDGSIKGLIQKICVNCVSLPTEIAFNTVFYRGSTILVYSGQTYTLSVSLESFLPTKTYPAILTDLKNGKEVPFVCRTHK